MPYRARCTLPSSCNCHEAYCCHPLYQALRERVEARAAAAAAEAAAAAAAAAGLPLAAELRTLKAELAYLVAELARARAEGVGGEGGEGSNSGAADEEVKAVVAAAEQRVAAAEARAEARAESEASKAAAAEAVATAAADRAEAAAAAAAEAHGRELEEIRGDHGRQLEAISISHGRELEEIREALQLRGAELERERAGFVKGREPTRRPSSPLPMPLPPCGYGLRPAYGPERSAPVVWVPTPKQGLRRRSGVRFNSPMPRCLSSKRALTAYSVETLSFFVQARRDAPRAGGRD